MAISGQVRLGFFPRRRSESIRSYVDFEYSGEIVVAEAAADDHYACVATICGVAGEHSDPAWVGRSFSFKMPDLPQGRGDALRELTGQFRDLIGENFLPHPAFLEWGELAKVGES